MPEEIFVLKKMKILDLSNNDLQTLPPELGLLKTLNKLQIEGNPLRAIRMAIRQGGTETIKKYLASKITEEDIANKQGQGAKGSLIQEEFNQKTSTVSKMVQLVRQMKNTNGDLDLRSKGLTLEDFTEDILSAEKVKSLDISDNKLEGVPRFIEQLNPISLKINNNRVTQVDISDIINFTCLKDIEMKGNKMLSFCDKINTKDDFMLVKLNFAQLTYLDLSQNSLTRVPSIVSILPNIRSLILSYNNIDTLDDLFREESVPLLDHLDMGSNNLRDVPASIYRWQTLTSLNLQNNSIKNFPSEMGYLNLKSFNIAGNPTMLLKTSITNKGVPALMNYLREKVVDKRQIEQEISDLAAKSKNYALPPKKPQDLEEYQFVDPFKKRAVDYQSKQDAKYGEIYEEELRDHLTQQRSPVSRMQPESTNPKREPPVRNSDGRQARNMDIESPYSNQSRGQPVLGTSSQSSNYSNHGQIRGNPMDIEKPVRGQAQSVTTGGGSTNLAKELDSKIKSLQDNIDNDYTLSKVKIAELRKELAQLKIQRNTLFK